MSVTDEATLAGLEASRIVDETTGTRRARATLTDSDIMLLALRSGLRSGSPDLDLEREIEQDAELKRLVDQVQGGF